MTWYTLLIAALRLLFGWILVGFLVALCMPLLPLDASDDYVSPDDDSPA